MPWDYGSGVNERVDSQRLFVLAPQLVEFRRIDDDVLAFGVLIPGENFVLCDLAMDGAGLLVFDP
jgi:hypothetical protein